MIEAIMRLLFEVALWNERRREAAEEKVKAGRRALREELEKRK